MGKIKILYIIGGENFDNRHRKFLSVIRNLDAGKYEFNIVCSENLLLMDYLKSYDVPVYLLSLPSRISSRYTNLINKLYLGEKFDIVHSFDYISGIYSRLLKKFNPEVKCIHSTESLITIERKGVFTKQIVKSTMQYYSLFTDRMISENDNDKKLAVKNKYIEKLNASVIPASVQVSRFGNLKKNYTLLTDIGFSKENFIIGCAAPFEDNNNQQLIIRTAYYIVKKYPQIRFLFIGDGKNLNNMKEFANTSGILDFCSFVFEKENIEDYYSIMDLFIAPDKWGGSAYTLFEAMASRLPIICSTAAEYSAFSRHKHSLVSFDPEDMDDLFDNIDYYYQHREERDEIAQNAMIEATQYDDSVIFPMVENVYNEVLGG